jgi:HK97 family phage major capsid protein
MKRLLSFLVAIIMLTVAYAGVLGTTKNELCAITVTMGLAAFSAIMHRTPSRRERRSLMRRGLAFTTIVIPDFTAKSADEFEGMTAKEQGDYLTAKREFESATIRKELQDDIDKMLKEDAQKNQEAIKAIQAQMDQVIKEHEAHALKLKSATERQGPRSENKGLRQYIEDNSEILKAIKSAGKSGNVANKMIGFTIEKGLEGAADIGGRDYLGTIEPGIGRKPVRRPLIMDLFRRKNVGTEYLHYWEQNVVTRDAKFVIACATSTHNTKVTWAKRTVELAKIRDIIDVCLDMLEDYTFVESELKMLIDESIKLKADYELLLGASVAATDMLSIDSIASEFNAANPLADYTAKFQAATLGDLTAAMKAQIYTFGQENMWQADTVLMNYNDMITYLHAKDANNNYLFPNFVLGSTDVVNGMRIVTSPIVEANTLYVFDSMKGVILDRKKITVATSYENRDNIEHELVTFVAHERLQFHVRLIDRDAFMKVSDIAAALTAITAP